MTRHVPQQARAPISERPAGPLTAQCLAVPGGDAMKFSVGIDWATQAHAVCILDQTGRVQWQGSGPHTAAGLAPRRVTWRGLTQDVSSVPHELARGRAPREPARP